MLKNVDDKLSMTMLFRKFMSQLYSILRKFDLGAKSSTDTWRTANYNLRPASHSCYEFLEIKIYKHLSRQTNLTVVSKFAQAIQRSEPVSLSLYHSWHLCQTHNSTLSRPISESLNFCSNCCRIWITLQETFYQIPWEWLACVMKMYSSVLTVTLRVMVYPKACKFDLANCRYQWHVFVRFFGGRLNAVNNSSGETDGQK